MGLCCFDAAPVSMSMLSQSSPWLGLPSLRLPSCPSLSPASSLSCLSKLGFLKSERCSPPCQEGPTGASSCLVNPNQGFRSMSCICFTFVFVALNLCLLSVCGHQSTCLWTITTSSLHCRSWLTSEGTGHCQLRQVAVKGHGGVASLTYRSFASYGASMPVSCAQLGLLGLVLEWSSSRSLFWPCHSIRVFSPCLCESVLCAW